MKNKRYFYVRDIKKIYEENSLVVDRFFVLNVINRVLSPRSKKIYKTSKIEDSQGYSDYILGVKKIDVNHMFVEETEIHAFRLVRGGNPYLRSVLDTKTKVTIPVTDQNGDESKLYAYSGGMNYQRIDKLVKNVCDSVERKMTKKYIYDFKGILLLTHRMKSGIKIKQTFVDKWKYFESFNSIEEGSKGDWLKLYDEVFLQTICRKIYEEGLQRDILSKISKGQFKFCYLFLNIFDIPTVIDLNEIFSNKDGNGPLIRNKNGNLVVELFDLHEPKEKEA